MARLGKVKSSYQLSPTPWQSGNATPTADEAPDEGQQTPLAPQEGRASSIPMGEWMPQQQPAKQTASDGSQPLHQDAAPSEREFPPSPSATKDVPSGVSGFSSPQSPRITAPEGYWQQQLASLPKAGEKKPLTADDLISQWETDDAKKKAAYERSRRAHSALDNIFKGYEAFFNSMAVRKGALSTPSASSQEQQAAQDRFARYQQDRADRKEAYTRKMAKLRQDQQEALQQREQAIKLSAEARALAKQQADQQHQADTLNETIRKNKAAEDYNASRLAADKEKQAALQDLNERKFQDQQRVNSHRIAALDAAAAANRAKAGGTGSGGASKIYAAAGWTYDLPKNMSDARFKQMQADIMSKLGISEQVPVMVDSGKKDKNGKPIMEQATDDSTQKPLYRKRTQSEIAGLINHRWNTQAGDIVRSYGGTVREGNSQTGKRASDYRKPKASERDEKKDSSSKPKASERDEKKDSSKNYASLKV